LAGNSGKNNIQTVNNIKISQSKKRKRQVKKKYEIKCDECGDEFSSENEDRCLCDYCEYHFSG